MEKFEGYYFHRSPIYIVEMKYSLNHPHTMKHPPPEMSKEFLRYKEIRFREFKQEIGRFTEEETPKLLNLFPQDERKLHNSK
jgi:hypothetical protein